MQDTRCCGTGTCLIDTLGSCWCGQQWDGEQMRHPSQTPASTDNPTCTDDASKADDVEGQPS